MELNIPDLVTAIDRALRAAERAPDAIRLSTLKGQFSQIKIELPSDLGGSGAAEWNSLPLDKRQDLESRLEQLHGEVDKVMAAIECDHPESIMSRTCVGNAGIVLLLAIAITGLIGNTFVIWQHWPDATGSNGSPTELLIALDLAKQDRSESIKRLATAQKELQEAEREGASVPPIKDRLEAAAAPLTDVAPDRATAPKESEIDILKRALEEAVARNRESHLALLSVEHALSPRHQDVLLMVILMGSLGGFIHLSSSMSMYVGNRAFRRSWIPFYLLAPFQGAALSPIVFLLIAGTILSPGSDAGTVGSSMNLKSVYAFSAMTGLFAKQAIEKLAEVFVTLFTQIKAKDGIK